MWYLIISALLIVVALLGTLAVGFSPSNKEEGSQYTRRTGKNMWLQTAFYIVGTVLFAVIVVAYAL